MQPRHHLRRRPGLVRSPRAQGRSRARARHRRPRPARRRAAATPVGSRRPRRSIRDGIRAGIHGHRRARNRRADAPRRAHSLGGRDPQLRPGARRRTGLCGLPPRRHRDRTGRGWTIRRRRRPRHGCGSPATVGGRARAHRRHGCLRGGDRQRPARARRIGRGRLLDVRARTRIRRGARHRLG